MDKQKFIMLHDISYLRDGKYEIVRFVLNISKIINITENMEADFSIADIIEKDKSKIIHGSFGKHFSKITMDYLNADGNQKVFHAIEDVSYIYSKINNS